MDFEWRVKLFTGGLDSIRFEKYLYKHITYQLLNMLKIKREIYQQDLQMVDLHFVIFPDL